MSKLLQMIFVLFATKAVAGYHEAFNEGFDEFAKELGFKNYSDFLEKREICAGIILSSQIPKNKKQDSKLIQVMPPEGYHWMMVQGIYTLMQNPPEGYAQHVNSKLIAEIPLFPSHLPKSETLEPGTDANKTASFIEVSPPLGYHWMSNDSSYLLMKNPSSGYSPHSASGYKSSLELKFAVYSKNVASSELIDNYNISEVDKVGDASTLLHEQYLNSGATKLENLFSNVDKKLWQSNRCSLRMFIELNTLANSLESELTGSSIYSPTLKNKPSANNYGYGY